MQLFSSFLRLGMTAFGGPAMVAHIKELSIKRNRWLDEEAFKNGVALCQTIPGATAMQVAAYVGLKTRGVQGALVSYAGFGLPAFVLMLTLAMCYANSRSIPQSTSLFIGLQVVVVAIIAHAAYTFGRNTLKNATDAMLIALAAVLFWRGLSPFFIILGAAIAGMAFYKNTAPTRPIPGDNTGAIAQSIRHSIICIVMASVGLAGLYSTDSKLFSLAALLLKIDIMAFGGGFAALPLMFHEIVNVRGWLDSKTFMDGIALGQVTPGPIVITATFIGYLVGGLVGGVVATVAMFTPSFAILLIVSPFFERLKSTRYFAGATSGILASFVGLLLFMTVRFALAVPWETGKVLLCLAVVVALTRKINITYIVLACAAASVLLFK